MEKKGLVRRDGDGIVLDRFHDLGRDEAPAYVIIQQQFPRVAALSEQYPVGLLPRAAGGVAARGGIGVMALRRPAECVLNLISGGGGDAAALGDF
jgi:hypothetical protein